MERARVGSEELRFSDWKISATAQEMQGTISRPSSESPTSRVWRSVPKAQRIVTGTTFTARYMAAPFAEFAPHSHSAYTVTVVLAGVGSMTVGETAVAFRAGASLLTNPGQLHAGSASALELVSISLTPALVEEQLTAMGLYQAGARVIFSTTDVSNGGFADIARLVADELHAERIGHHAMVEALVRQLVVQLGRSYLTVRRAAGVELSRAGPVDRRLRRAVELMHDHYSRDLSLADLAQAAYLSDSHFSHLFKEITGRSPLVYLANLRIERARHLLLRTDLPIGAIARCVGYRSQSHFARAFKAAAGVSPREYRAGLIAGH